MFSEILTTHQITILVFVLFLIAFLWKDRENIERHGLLFLRRTKKGIELIKRIAERFSGFFKVWSTVGVYLSLVVTVFGFLFLLHSVVNTLFQAGLEPAVGLVLPTVSETPSMSPGVFFIPFWYWIIGVASVMVVHEMSHGIVGVNEGFNIKSVGWLLLAILPGAFVEPEGEEMLPEKKQEEDGEEESSTNPWGEGPALSKLRVLAAGSWSNLCFALLIVVLLFSITTAETGQREIIGMYEHNGVRISTVANNSPAQEQGLEEGMVIQSIGGQEVRHSRDFQQATSGITPNQTLEISGKFNSSDFSINGTAGETFLDTNATYEPAPLDKLAVSLEKRVSGSLENYMKVQDVFINPNDETRYARWNWVQEQGVLEERAEQEMGEILENYRPRGYFGFGIMPESEVTPAFEPFETASYHFLQLMLFLFIIHSGVAVANLLPIIPLDGGWMVSEVINEYKPEWDTLAKKISVVGVALFILTLLLPILL